MFSCVYVNTGLFSNIAQGVSSNYPRFMISSFSGWRYFINDKIKKVKKETKQKRQMFYQ